MKKEERPKKEIKLQRLPDGNFIDWENRNYYTGEDAKILRLVLESKND